MNKIIIATALAVALAIAASPTTNAAVTRDLSWPTSWDSPLGGDQVKVTANYLALSFGCSNADRRDAYRYYSNDPKKRWVHLGLDLDASVGTPVYAMADGFINNDPNAALGAYTPWGTEWGEVLFIVHRDSSNRSRTAAYGHITRGINLQAPGGPRAWVTGDVVRRGDLLGTVKKLSIASPHIHIGHERGVLNNFPGLYTAPGKAGTVCTIDTKGTSSPETELQPTTPAPWTASIVGWKNGDGSVTSWQVARGSDGKLGRLWIADKATYFCLTAAGFVDWGPLQASTLDQLVDRRNVWASCR